MNDTSSEYCRVGQCRALGRSTQIEQDLIISRAVVAIFTDPFLREALRFRGGTALNKLHFPAPLRYSEDINLVRTEAGPIGPVLDAFVSSSSRGLDTVSTSQVRSHPS
nr:nucleotidyl transferase AbiEii/AbiGii toxin family protein [Rhizobium laguerreae]